jgi:hypothetical protein
MLNRTFNDYQVALQPSGDDILMGILLEGIGDQFEGGSWSHDGADLLLHGKTESWRMVDFAGEELLVLEKTGKLHLLDVTADTITICTKQIINIKN